MCLVGSDVGQPEREHLNHVMSLTADRRSRSQLLAEAVGGGAAPAAGKLWPWGGDTYVNGISVCDPYDDHELLPRVTTATWVCVWAEALRARRLLAGAVPAAMAGADAAADACARANACGRQGGGAEVDELLCELPADLYHVPTRGTGLVEEELCALFLLHNWFFLGVTTRVCKVKKRLFDPVVPRHDNESILHVKLLALRPAAELAGGSGRAGGEEGGCGRVEAVVEDAEVLAHATHFVSRVRVKPAGGGVAEGGYRPGLCAGSVLCLEDGEWQRVLSLVESVWPDLAGKGGEQWRDAFFETKVLADHARAGGSVAGMDAGGGASSAVERALVQLARSCRACDDRRRAQEQRQQRMLQKRNARRDSSA